MEISIVTDSPGSAVTFDSDMRGVLAAVAEKLQKATKIKQRIIAIIFFCDFHNKPRKKVFFYLNISLK